ncbi:hypothetical protein DPMN_012205 [Dreissena polymorpha]|uniref:Uncharacterized protein n=2 Tax=Dreissena polymorpha TaxID=45954 RepID=A0A9D4N5E8_DREPO|nr:hypothetical protein DPMN_012205 [Dreissena polymorpha]
MSKESIKVCYNTSTSPPVLDEKCLLDKCLNPKDVYELSGLSRNNTGAEVATLSTILLHTLENSECATHEKHQRPSQAEAWGFGILCTTVINICSLGGVIALPFIHGDMYKKVLIYMVGLAVGTLAGSSLLFLIPEALELTEQELDINSHVWKSMVVIVGIFAFFNIERILKMITEWREKNNDRTQTTGTSMDFSSFHQTRNPLPYKNVDGLPHLSPCGENDSSGSDKDSTGTSSISLTEIDQVRDENTQEDLPINAGRPQHHHSHRKVKPVAWMIIFGDGLHNFIDGISIGAAFTESILAGVSVSIAIFCEELPHELGDFAVLLNAGMKMKKAVLYNFMSACMCYLGLIVGIILGENTAAHTWVFAFAGGMFLYISLVDMMPEMNAATEVEDNKNMNHFAIYILQNLGLLTGFALMVIMAIYGGSLENAIKGIS